MNNQFLAALTPPDRDLLGPLLRKARLEQRTVLYETGRTVSAVYLPIDALVSIVVTLSTGEMIEAAMLGRDGIVGASFAIDSNVSTNRAVVQLGGETLICDSGAFKKAVLKSPTLLSMVIRHEQTVLGQAQQSAACIAAHEVEARLARWLLRARDLAGSDGLPFTQEFLANMLGVQRTSVTLVAHTLQRAGMIRYHRGRIEITDLDALRETSCECYATINDQYRDLLGTEATTK